MSRGLGQVQKKCLEALARKVPGDSDDLVRQGVFETIMIACSVFGQDVISQAQYASVRRALGALARKGLVKNLGRHWHNNRGRWALPEAAKIFWEREKRAGFEPSLPGGARGRDKKS